MQITLRRVTNSLVPLVAGRQTVSLEPQSAAEATVVFSAPLEVRGSTLL